MKKTIPIIDLFAGPGGLGEGFSSLIQPSGDPVFEIKNSIEKDILAHRTLTLRAAYRHLRSIGVPDSYYDYIRGSISRLEFERDPKVRDAVSLARHEAKNETLGVTPNEKIDKWIRNGLQGETNWLLIGGPPCQAYSLAGRSRMKGRDPQAFEQDHRHFLYREYLRIIREHKPAVFVMENVKGILSSTHAGSFIFEQIMHDLASPSDDINYELRSFVVSHQLGERLSPKDFIICAEQYGIPQARHRVILLGVRKDMSHREMTTLKKIRPTSIEESIQGLPPLRSQISRQGDSYKKWHDFLKATIDKLHYWEEVDKEHIVKIMRSAIIEAKKNQSIGGDFIYGSPDFSKMPEYLVKWFQDKRLDGVTQHVSRGHMPSDIQRYFFSACYAEKKCNSPKIRQFPLMLLPQHKNIKNKKIPFEDRFRVQLKGYPSTTIVSHISKDGHYYIHYDPVQCRSLTVREAARLQTFPDNYFFEGTRTEQYVQVGNAVPPLLAKQLAEVVAQLFGSEFI